jgi:pimeloyl-ACP methyl ester carboxylesterase
VRTKHGAPGPAGLECDKLSARATRVQFDHYVGPILAAVRQVPGARIEMIPRCGHCPQIEAPERLAEILHAFPAEPARAA